MLIIDDFISSVSFYVNVSTVCAFLVPFRTMFAFCAMHSMLGWYVMHVQ